MKPCSKCGGPKREGRTHSWCNACSALAARVAYRRDPAPVKAAVQKWRERNPTIYVETRAAWRKNNRERLRRQGRDDAHKRRAARAGAGGRGVVAEQWSERIAEFGGCCAYCNLPLVDPEMEHMDPLSSGGEHDIDNVVPACRECNASKYTLTALEFLTGFRLDGKAAVAI